MTIDMNKLAGTHRQQLDNLKMKSQNADQNIKQQTVQSQAQTHSSSSPQAKDSVTLTQQAQQLHKSNDKLTNTSSINQEKVESIRKAIEAGEYKVDPQKLAQNLAKFEGELAKIF